VLIWSYSDVVLPVSSAVTSTEPVRALHAADVGSKGLIH